MRVKTKKVNIDVDSLRIAKASVALKKLQAQAKLQSHATLESAFKVLKQ